MVGQTKVEITIARKIIIENMRTEVSENVIQYQQIVWEVHTTNVFL
jgi:hypothetical protein